jgi:ABC-type glycerol-3-phosphate transport system substrate-binding protein
MTTGPVGILGLLAIIAVVSGITITASRPPTTSIIPIVWTFSPDHARDLAAIAGNEIDISTVPARAMDVRLTAMASADTGAAPDLVEIEIGGLGKHFRGTAVDVPFLPLTDRLKTSGWLEKLSPARVAAWSHDGEVFGLPLDVHPVAITYRRDLFDTAGVDLAAAKTWAAFHERCLAFEAFERRNGRTTRAIQLPSASADVVLMMLQQQGIDPVDNTGRPRLDDDRVTDTIAFYATLVAGRASVATDPTPGPGRWINDLQSGVVAAVVTADWAVEELLTAAPPDLPRKLALMPLPVFAPNDAPTASWGGTAVTIPRACRDPDRAWALLERLYLSDTAQRTRARPGRALPAVVGWWPDAFEPDLAPDSPFAVASHRQFAALARRLPRRVLTPYTAMASSALSLVLYRAQALVEAGADEAQLHAAVHHWLTDAQADLQTRIGFANLGR